MVSINIAAGQGMTQAIATKLGLTKDDCKKINLATWQNVLTEVKNAQETSNKANEGATDKKGSIFTGGSDVQAIGKSSGWKDNFVVKQGDVEIDNGVWAKIANLLKPGSAPVEEQVEPQPNKIEPKHPELLENKLEPIKVNVESLEAPTALNASKDLNKAVTTNIVDTLDGKFLTREVDGKKQEIAIVDTKDGKVRRAVNEDNTLGDILVPISTAGKNKYITQTEFDNKMRAALDLEQGKELPNDIKGEFVNIGGSPTLFFKKDGKTLDQAGLRDYVKNLHANDSKVDANIPAIKGNEGINGSAEVVSNNNLTVGETNTAPIQPKMTKEQAETYLKNDSYFTSQNKELSELKKKAHELQEADKVAFENFDVNAFEASGLSAFSAENAAKKMESALNSYKNQIENWQDGARGTMNIKGTGETGYKKTSYNIDYEQVTYNGEKAYKEIIEEDGKKFAVYHPIRVNEFLGKSGLDPDKIIGREELTS